MENSIDFTILDIPRELMSLQTSNKRLRNIITTFTVATIIIVVLWLLYRSNQKNFIKTDIEDKDS